MAKTLDELLVEPPDNPEAQPAHKERMLAEVRAYKLRELREMLALTQTDVAEVLAISQKRVSEIELAKWTARRSTIGAWPGGPHEGRRAAPVRRRPRGTLRVEVQVGEETYQIA